MQGIVAVIVVLAAACWVARRVYCVVTIATRGGDLGKGSCGSCGNCPSNRKPTDSPVQSSPLVSIGGNVSRIKTEN
jgi:hypothetical protein